MPGIRTRLAVVVAALGVLASPAAASGAAFGPAGVAGQVAGVNSLSSVKCPTASTCVAVGTDSSLNGKSVIITAATGAAKAWSGN